MKEARLRYSVCLLLFFALPCTAASSPPNIVFVLADDLGWMDTSVYGSQFYETPNVAMPEKVRQLDRLIARHLHDTAALVPFARPACGVGNPHEVEQSRARPSVLDGRAATRSNPCGWSTGRAR